MRYIIGRLVDIWCLIGHGCLILSLIVIIPSPIQSPVHCCSVMWIILIESTISSIISFLSRSLSWVPRSWPSLKIVSQSMLRSVLEIASWSVTKWSIISKHAELRSFVVFWLIVFSLVHHLIRHLNLVIFCKLLLYHFNKFFILACHCALLQLLYILLVG